MPEGFESADDYFFAYGEKLVVLKMQFPSFQ